MKIPRFFSSRWGFLLIVLAMSAMIIDRHLEPREEHSRITTVLSRIVRSSQNRHEWTLVRTEHDISLQVPRAAYSFRPGAPIDIRRTAVFGDVIAYTLPDTYEGWHPMAEAKVTYRSFAYFILIGALLLLVKKWPVETEVVIVGFTCILALIWVLMLAANNWLKILVIFS